MKKSLTKLELAYRYLYPRLTTIVSCGTIKSPNAITIAWSCPLSVNPPLVGVLIAPNRHSHKIIKKTRDFVINIPNFSSKMIEGSFHIGSISGLDEPEKIINSGLSVEPSKSIKSPRILECKVHLECKLADVISTGDHDLFVGKVVDIIVDPEIVDKWAVNLDQFSPIYWRQSKYKEEAFEIKKKENKYL